MIVYFFFTEIMLLLYIDFTKRSKNINGDFYLDIILNLILN